MYLYYGYLFFNFIYILKHSFDFLHHWKIARAVTQDKLLNKIIIFREPTRAPLNWKTSDAAVMSLKTIGSFL